MENPFAKKESKRIEDLVGNPERAPVFHPQDRINDLGTGRTWQVGTVEHDASGAVRYFVTTIENGNIRGLWATEEQLLSHDVERHVLSPKPDLSAAAESAEDIRIEKGQDVAIPRGDECEDGWRVLRIAVKPNNRNEILVEVENKKSGAKEYVEIGALKEAIRRHRVARGLADAFGDLMGQ